MTHTGQSEFFLGINKAVRRKICLQSSFSWDDGSLKLPQYTPPSFPLCSSTFKTKNEASVREEEMREGR